MQCEEIVSGKFWSTHFRPQQEADKKPFSDQMPQRPFPVKLEFANIVSVFFSITICSNCDLDVKIY